MALDVLMRLIVPLGVFSYFYSLEIHKRMIIYIRLHIYIFLLTFLRRKEKNKQ